MQRLQRAQPKWAWRPQLLGCHGESLWSIGDIKNRYKNETGRLMFLENFRILENIIREFRMGSHIEDILNCNEKNIGNCKELKLRMVKTWIGIG